MFNQYADTNKVSLSIPFHTQLNNDSDHNSGWWNECSFTSMAMYLRSFGFVGTGAGQFEDQIEKDFEADNLRRGEPWSMNRFLKENYPVQGITHTFDPETNWQLAFECLDAGFPLIAHTWLTNSGHILLIKGYDFSAYGDRGAFIVHDPFGEWFPTGYDTNKSGANLLYSFSLAKRLIGTDGDLWLHYPEPTG